MDFKVQDVVVEEGEAEVEAGQEGEVLVVEVEEVLVVEVEEVGYIGYNIFELQMKGLCLKRRNPPYIFHR